ncbi:MAG: ABC transporter permease [Cyclobacteriaceae bacterium]|nr:ABC transporter permease [Cyclobacteriaceae bacterium]
MRPIRFLLEKEFKQIFRNKAMLPIILVLPVIQLLILSFAVDYEIKNIKLFVMDQDKSSYSRLLIDKFTASDYFQVTGVGESITTGYSFIADRKSDLVLHIPARFERSLVRKGSADLQLIIDAIDGAKAGLIANYSTSIIQEFNKEIILTDGMRMANGSLIGFKTADIIPRFRFNPLMDYKSFMVPGILVILVTMIGAFLSGMNIVREKELGTIEQINVTPIKKYQFILGKTIPFWIIGLFELSVGLTAAKLIFDIPMVGSLWVLYAFAAIYLLLVLGFGLFISTLTNTQQQAMFISWFFLVIFILMGGLFTPIENMPEWAQTITLFNPIRYFIEVTRSVLLKGSGFAELRNHFMIISGYAILIIGLAVLRYRKTA